MTNDYQHHQKEDNQTFLTSWQNKNSGDIILKEKNKVGELRIDTTQFQDLIYRCNNQNSVVLIKEETE